MKCKICNEDLVCAKCDSKVTEEKKLMTLRTNSELMKAIEKFAKKHSVSKNGAINSLLQHMLIDSETCGASCKCNH